VWEYVKEQAIPRYDISPQGKVYKWIKEFLDMLLEKPFTEDIKKPVNGFDFKVKSSKIKSV
jgi:hypothetical protein